MEFRILGPLEVIRQGQALPPPPNKPRALLALLLLQRGEAVTLERLADDLWGEHPPATAAKSVQVYVSQLRKLLGEGVVETRGHGYALAIDREQVDAVRFERLLDQGAQHLADGRAKEASQTLTEALSLWRGAPLADFAYESWAQAEIARLEDLRVAALEERVDADLALGRHGTLIAELEGLVGRHPTRERLCGQLMLALYRSGRQSEALDAYRERRRRMVDELGIEPGPALRELEAAILRQDSELQAPARFSAPLLRRRRRRRRRGGALIALGGAALLLAALAAGVVALVREADTPVGAALEPLPASSCSPVDFASGSDPQHLIVADVPLQGPPRIIGNQIAAAVEYVLRENGFSAGGRAVAYQACDSDIAGCAETAEAYAVNPAVLGVVGPLSSACAEELIPVANQARPGPLAVISPSNTRVSLTRPDAGLDPEDLYPTGVRNYVRVLAADDFQFAAGAIRAQQLGARRVYVLHANEEFIETADLFSNAAEKLGLKIVGTASLAAPRRYRAQARKLKRAGADAVFVAAAVGRVDGARLTKSLRAVLGPELHILAPDGFSAPDLVAEFGRAGEGMRISVPGADPQSLTGSGRRLIEGLRETIGEPHPYTVSAAQAAQMLLDAVGRSDGTRRSVVDELFASEVRGGVLGDFSVTATGDTTANRVSIYRVEGGELRLDRVLTPPLSLVVPR